MNYFIENERNTAGMIGGVVLDFARKRIGARDDISTLARHAARAAARVLYWESAQYELDFWTAIDAGERSPPLYCMNESAIWKRRMWDYINS